MWVEARRAPPIGFQMPNEIHTRRRGAVRRMAVGCETTVQVEKLGFDHKYGAMEGRGAGRLIEARWTQAGGAFRKTPRTQYTAGAKTLRLFRRRETTNSPHIPKSER